MGEIKINVSKIDDDNFIGIVSIYGKKLGTFAHGTDYAQTLEQCLEIVKQTLSTEQRQPK